jgi:hypothetical protein
MTQQHTLLRSGMTAIAAVLALSSTAAFAQTADQSVADPSAPMIAAPPPPAAAEAPIAIAPVEAAPATATPMTATTPDAAPAATAPAAAAVAPMATRSTPVIHTPEAAAAERASATSQRSASSARTTTTSRSIVTTRSTTPPVTAAPKATPAPAPAITPAPVLKPATPPAPATTATTRTTTQTAANDTLPIAAGAIGLGLIALGAGAYLFARRRREDDEDVIVGTEPTEGTIVTPVTSPVYAVAPEAVTAVPGTPIMAREDIGDEQMTLANGFDLSHFGRHARAAYRGPTADNPSHSLKRRLARASFFDQREREAIANGTAPAEPTPLAARTAKAPAAAQNEDQIVVRPGYRRPSRFFGTAFQR